MLQLNSISLKNLVLFEDQDFKFEEGITLISGRNRTGKSLLLSPLKTLLCGSTSEDQLPAGSHVELKATSVNVDGAKTRLHIVADTPKTKTQWDLRVNTQAMDTHRVKDGRALIDKYVGLPAEVFSVVCHILGSNPSPLRFGTPSSKLEWVSALFNLSDSYSMLEESVSTRLAQATAAEVELRYAEKAYVKPIKPDMSQLPDLEKRVSKMREAMNQHMQQETLREELNGLMVQVSSLSKRKTKYKTRQEMSSRLRAIATEMDMARDYADAMEDYNRLYLKHQNKKTKFEKVVDRLPKGYVPTSPKHLKSLIEQVVTETDANEQLIEGYGEEEFKYEKWLKAKPSLKQPRVSKDSFDKATKAVSSLEYKIRDITKRIKDMEETEEGPCPECGNEITEKHKRTVVKRERAKKQECTTRKIRCEETVYMYGQQQVALNKVPAPKSMDELSARSKYLEGVLSDLVYLRNLDLGSKPKKPDMEAPDVDLKSLRSEKDDIQQDLALLDAMGQEKFPSNTRKQEERIQEIKSALGAKKKFDAYEYEGLSERVVALKLERDKYHKDKQAYDEHIGEIEELRIKSRRIRPLKALKEAFGKTGLRLGSLTDSLHVLMQELNNTAPLLFDEKFKFDVETGPRRLNMLIERNGKVSGMRGMSMSELRCWTLLFSTAMLKLLPPRMLTDTIILDEMESNMDPINKARYSKEFIPYLQTLVPKVIVVSPLMNSELSIQPDRAYVVEKKNNVSTLRML